VKNRVATRFAGVERSATVALIDKVQSMRAQGVSVLDFGGGDPDFATAPHIAGAATAALGEGFTHYTSSRGIAPLVAAIAEKLRRDNGIAADPASDVIVTPSAKHALFATMMTILDPGDELIVPTPSWVSYQSMAQLAGGRAVAAELDPADGFRITRELLERHAGARTKALLINSPCNPTGRALSGDEAAAVAAFARERDLFVVADEIYEKILFGEARHVSLATLPGMAERTFTVNGFSKAYAMTGWRLGYVTGPTDVMKQMLKVQEHTVSCAGSFVQRGGVAALTGDQRVVADMVAEYAARRRLIVDGLNALPGIACAAPDGAFYVFPDVRGTGFDRSAEFAAWLLDEAGVAVTPGSAFGPGGEGHVRLSFATSRETISAALERMAAALAKRPPAVLANA
jgi:aspartate aminotransferase